MICPRCQLTAEPMTIFSQEEDNEGGETLYIVWECQTCKGTVDTIYQIISMVGPEVQNNSCDMTRTIGDRQ